jgi:3-deoxy-D-manno-octulosonate 8-phosphate phosphatase (KDO 8-P phosphatase)
LETTLAERCAAIELLLLDVDGVLTEGGIVYADDQVELKSFYVRDGAALKIWQMRGKRAAILSGRTSRVVEIRANEMGITTVLQGDWRKWGGYQQVLAACGVTPKQIAYVADDVADLPVLYDCGLAVAVADACPDVLRAAHYVTRSPGGRGAVRETVEVILRCQGHWQEMMREHFEARGEG